MASEQVERDSAFFTQDEEKIVVPVDPKVKGTLKEAEHKGFSVLDELSKDDIRSCTEKALNKVNAEHDMVLSLEKSTKTVNNQEFVLVSFVAPKGTRQKTDAMGLKVWGAFPTQEKAAKHAKILNSMEENRYFDIYTLEMYTWAAIPPDPKQIEDQEYHDKKLNKLIWAHKVEKEKSREVFEKRKLRLLENAEKNNILKLKEQREERLKSKEQNENNDYQRVLLMPSKPMPKMEIVEDVESTTTMKLSEKLTYNDFTEENEKTFEELLSYLVSEGKWDKIGESIRNKAICNIKIFVLTFNEHNLHEKYEEKLKALKVLDPSFEY